MTTEGSRPQIETRALAVPEYRQAAELFHLAMHGPPLPASWDEAPAATGPAGLLGAFAGDGLAGMGQGMPTAVTVPGGASVPARILTRFAVRPGLTRLGAGTALMKTFLSASGEPVVVLRASEGGIYERFGFGVATRAQDFLVDCSRAAMAGGVRPGGAVRVLPLRDAVPDVLDLYRRVPRRPGMVDRPAYFEALYRAEAASGGLLAAVSSGPGGDEAFAVYVTRREEAGYRRENLVADVVDLHCRTAAGWRALWAFLAGIDLVDQVLLRSRPTDEPAPWLFADPRACQTVYSADEMWLRVTDVPAALAARSYGRGDGVVIEVRDGFLPANSGRYAVTSRGAARTALPAQLSVDVSTLASLYLGCARPSALAAAGRVTVLDDGAALPSADLLFAVPGAPWCGTTI